MTLGAIGPTAVRWRRRGSRRRVPRRTELAVAAMMLSLGGLLCPLFHRAGAAVMTGRVVMVFQDNFGAGADREFTVLKLLEPGQFGEKDDWLSLDINPTKAGFGNGDTVTVDLIARQPFHRVIDRGADASADAEVIPFAQSQGAASHDSADGPLYGVLEVISVVPGRRRARRDSPIINGIEERAGEHEVILIRVEFTDFAPIADEANFSDWVWGGTGNTLHGLFREASLARLDIVPPKDPSIKSVYTVVLGESAAVLGSRCNAANNGWYRVYDLAKAAMQVQHGVDVLEVQLQAFLLPPEFGPGDQCGWEGLASFDCAYNECFAFVRSESEVEAPLTLGHEIGHTLRLAHAATDFNDDGLYENIYGDKSSLMGGVEPFWRSFNAVHRIRLGWIPEADIKVLSRPDCAVTSPEALGQTVIMSGLEGGPGLGGITFGAGGTVHARVVMIPRLQYGGGAYVLSYREPTGYDTSLPADLGGSRVQVHYARQMPTSSSYIDQDLLSSRLITSVKKDQTRAVTSAEFTISVTSSSNGASSDDVQVTVTFMCADPGGNSGEEDLYCATAPTPTDLQISGRTGQNQAEINGNYEVVEGETYNGRTVYQNELSGNFLYWMADKYQLWGIGAVKGDLNMYAYMRQDLDPPVGHTVGLQVWTGSSWQEDPKIRITCITQIILVGPPSSPPSLPPESSGSGSGWGSSGSHGSDNEQSGACDRNRPITQFGLWASGFLQWSSTQHLTSYDSIGTEEGCATACANWGKICAGFQVTWGLSKSRCSILRTVPNLDAIMPSDSHLIYSRHLGCDSTGAQVPLAVTPTDPPAVTTLSGNGQLNATNTGNQNNEHHGSGGGNGNDDGDLELILLAVAIFLVVVLFGALAIAYRQGPKLTDDLEALAAQPTSVVDRIDQKRTAGAIAKRNQRSGTAPDQAWTPASTEQSDRSHLLTRVSSKPAPPQEYVSVTNAELDTLMGEYAVTEGSEELIEYAPVVSNGTDVATAELVRGSASVEQGPTVTDRRKVVPQNEPAVLDTASADVSKHSMRPSQIAISEMKRPTSTHNIDALRMPLEEEEFYAPGVRAQRKFSRSESYSAATAQPPSPLEIEQIALPVRASAIDDSTNHKKVSFSDATIASPLVAIGARVRLNDERSDAHMDGQTIATGDSGNHKRFDRVKSRKELGLPPPVFNAPPAFDDDDSEVAQLSTGPVTDTPPSFDAESRDSNDERVDTPPDMPTNSGRADLLILELDGLADDPCVESKEYLVTGGHSEAMRKAKHTESKFKAKMGRQLSRKELGLPPPEFGSSECPAPPVFDNKDVDDQENPPSFSDSDDAGGSPQASVTAATVRRPNPASAMNAAPLQSNSSKALSGNDPEEQRASSSGTRGVRFMDDEVFAVGESRTSTDGFHRHLQLEMDTETSESKEYQIVGGFTESRTSNGTVGTIYQHEQRSYTEQGATSSAAREGDTITPTQQGGTHELAPGIEASAEISSSTERRAGFDDKRAARASRKGAASVAALAKVHHTIIVDRVKRGVAGEGPAVLGAATDSPAYLTSTMEPSQRVAPPAPATSTPPSATGTPVPDTGALEAQFSGTARSSALADAAQAPSGAGGSSVLSLAAAHNAVILDRVNRGIAADR